MNEKIGPKVKALMIYKASRDMVPSGSGIERVLDTLSNPKEFAASMRAALEWVKAAIIAVRQATEPNEWKLADDEAIAAEILKQIAAKNPGTCPFCGGSMIHSRLHGYVCMRCK